MKLNYKKTIFVGFAFLIICLFWQVYDNVIAKMLINTFGLSQTWSGIVMALDNVLAIILLPVFGALSDKTKSKYGKRTPYIAIGTILAAILFTFVAIFDNIQMKRLVDEENINAVVMIDDKLPSNYTEGLTNEEIDNLYLYHENDYWFSYSFTDEQVRDLFDSDNKKDDLLSRLLNSDEKNIRKYYKLSDVDLSEEVFVSLCDEVLLDSDRTEFNELLSLSHEERVKVVDGKRVHQWEISLLEKRLSERISDSPSRNDILNSVGIREFFSSKEDATQVRGKVAWVYTKSDLGCLFYFLFMLLLVLLSMSTFRTPAVSLMPDVTIKPLRSKANAIINLMGTVGGIISLLIMNFLAKDYQSYITLFIVVGMIMIILLILFLIKVNEPKLVKEMEDDSILYNVSDNEEELVDNKGKMTKEVRRSFFLILASIIFWFMGYNAATTKFSVYAGDVLNMGYSTPLLIANATALISFIPIGIISSKIGRKKTILFGIGILFTAFVLGSIATAETTFLIYLTMGVAGIGWATINVNSYPMIVEMSKSSNVGKYTGYYYTASMFAQIITPIISGLLMDITGTMRVLFPYSVVFCMFAFCTMIFVKHGDSKPVAIKTVEAYDAID